MQMLMYFTLLITTFESVFLCCNAITHVGSFQPILYSAGCLFPKNVMVYVIAENICATFRSSSIIWHDKNSLAVRDIVEEA